MKAFNKKRKPKHSIKIKWKYTYFQTENVKGYTLSNHKYMPCYCYTDSFKLGKQVVVIGLCH